MESGPGMSVVIPVRNGANVLGEQLDALLAAEHPPVDVEVIVVDNGSTDRTAQVALTYAPRLRVRVVAAAEAASSNYARNVGVQAAHADRIALCDADDQVDQAWLQAMWQAFEDGHDLVAGPIDYVRLNAPSVRAWRGASQSFVAPILGFLPSGHGASLGFTRALYEAVGGFDEEFAFGGPDIEFCWRAQLAGYVLVAEPRALVHYRLRPSLGALVRQARMYGAAEAHLYLKFRHAGLRRRPASTLIADLWWIVTRLPFAWPVSRRGAWLRRAAQQAGRVQGSLRYRVLWW